MACQATADIRVFQDIQVSAEPQDQAVTAAFQATAVILESLVFLDILAKQERLDILVFLEFQDGLAHLVSVALAVFPELLANQAFLESADFLE